MENKIVNVLIENNLYDKDKQVNISKCNLLDTFFNTYEFKESKKQLLPENITRDKNGYIILNEIPFISSNIDFTYDKFSHNEKSWLILNNGTKILAKSLNCANPTEKMEQELLIMYFLKSLNVSCANYDVAIINDKPHLISPSFLRTDEKIIRPFTQPETIKQAYEKCKKFGIEKHYLKTLFSDFAYGNPDRFPRNFCTIYNQYKNTFKICPLFDNGEFNFYKDSPTFPKLNKNQTNCRFEDAISFLLNFDEILHWLRGPVRKTNLETCATRLEKEKGILISKTTYNKYKFFFKDSEDIINDELKRKGQSFRIKLT